MSLRETIREIPLIVLKIFIKIHGYRKTMELLDQANKELAIGD